MPGTDKGKQFDLMIGFLFHCDGRTSLSEISEQLGVGEATLRSLVDLLLKKGIITV